MLALAKCQGIVLVLVYLFIGFLLIQAKEPPRLLSRHYEAVVHGRINEKIRLTCPVASSSPSKLLFSWTKDDESISGTWMRFAGDGPHLVIDDLEVDDSGLYSCMAINGYGSQQAAIRLIVEGPSESFSETSAEYDNLQPEQTIRELNFTDDTHAQAKFTLLTSGSSLTLECSVIGYPFPDLVWFKNGVLIGRHERGQLEESETGPLHFPLDVRAATVDSSGNYTCLALGLKGRIEITFTIKVLDASSNLPDMIEIESHNRTGRRGGTNKLLCWMHTRSRPEADWFKQVPRRGGRRDANTSLVVGTDHYLRLDSNDTVKKLDGSFLKQLVLHPLDDKDAGCYLCMASNNFGYNMKRTCLIVEPNYETNESKSVPFSIMVAIPSGLILSVAAGFVCWLRERERLRRLAEAAGVVEPNRTDGQQTPSARANSTESRSFGRQTLMSSPASGRQTAAAAAAPGGGSLVSVTPSSTDGGSFDIQQPNYYFDNQRRNMPRR